MNTKRFFTVALISTLVFAGFVIAQQKTDQFPPTSNPFSFNLNGTWVKMGCSLETIKSSFPNSKTSDTCQPMVPFDDEISGIPSATTILSNQLSGGDCVNFRFNSNRLICVELITGGTEGPGPVVDSFEKELMKAHGKGNVKDKNPPYVNTEWSVNGTRIIRYDYFSESGDAFTNFRMFTK